MRKGDISQQSVHKFYDAVRAYYTKALSYSVEWLPLENKITNNCDFVNFDLRPFCSFDQVNSIIALSFTVVIDFEFQHQPHLLFQF